MSQTSRILAVMLMWTSLNCASNRLSWRHWFNLEKTICAVRHPIRCVLILCIKDNWTVNPLMDTVYCAILQSSCHTCSRLYNNGQIVFILPGLYYIRTKNLFFTTYRSLWSSQNESRSLSCWAISAIIWRTVLSFVLSRRWRCCRWRASSMSEALYGITSGGCTLTFAKRSLPRCAADRRESFRHWYSPTEWPVDRSRHAQFWKQSYFSAPSTSSPSAGISVKGKFIGNLKHTALILEKVICCVGVVRKFGLLEMTRHFPNRGGELCQEHRVLLNGLKLHKHERMQTRRIQCRTWIQTKVSHNREHVANDVP